MPTIKMTKPSFSYVVMVPVVLVYLIKFANFYHFEMVKENVFNLSCATREIKHIFFHHTVLLYCLLLLFTHLKLQLLAH